MKFESVILGNQLRKKYKGFELNVPELQIPKGFATALIGENGAGKTTLLHMMAGIQLDYKGEFTYFNQYSSKNLKTEGAIKERIGYTGTGNYYLPQWTLKQVEEVQELLFDDFHKDRYESYCKDLGIYKDGLLEKNKKVCDLSDGTKIKLMLAGVLSRETDLLLMDEPASPLDPLMREKLCDLIRTYLMEKEGQRSVLFSTHNIADMENVTDYCIIMENGRMIEQGFVEELKEKYVVVKGEKQQLADVEDILMDVSVHQFGFEGMGLAENFENGDAAFCLERPTLTQIAVSAMRSAKQEERRVS